MIQDFIVIILLFIVACINFYVYIEVGISKHFSGEWKKLAEWQLEMMKEVFKK